MLLLMSMSHQMLPLWYVEEIEEERSYCNRCCYWGARCNWCYYWYCWWDHRDWCCYWLWYCLPLWYVEEIEEEKSHCNRCCYWEDRCNWCYYLVLLMRLPRLMLLFIVILFAIMIRRRDRIRIKTIASILISISLLPFGGATSTYIISIIYNIIAEPTFMS